MLATDLMVAVALTLALLGAILMLAAVYLLLLAVAALWYQPSAGVPRGRPRLAVVVPAHNEVDFIVRCIEALQRQSYPREAYDIVVIADNCTDRTAALAEQAGARVLVRDDTAAHGKGRALRWAFDQLIVGPSPVDALVVVDADSVADPGLLSGLASEFERGADAVQADYQVLEDQGSPGSQLRSAAFLLFHRARFSGRAVLGLPCSLVGNGMLFSRSLLEAHGWNAFSGAEDLEYTIELRLSGISPVFAGTALVRGPVLSSGRAAEVQRQRWEGGRLRIARSRLPLLLATIARERRLSLVDAAVDLALPPLGVLAGAAAAGLIVSGVLALAGVVASWAVIPWSFAVLGLAGYVVVGLVAAGATKSVYMSLLSAPRFMVAKAVGTAAVARASRRDSWVRTERPSERGA